MATIDWAARIRQYLNKSDANPDATAGEVLAAIGSAVQTAIENHTSRTLTNVTYTEAYDGHDKPVLYLRHAPIVSVSSLTIGGTAYAVGAPDYPAPVAAIVASGEALRLTSGVFACGVGNVLVTYTAGLASTETGQPPEDLVFAGVVWASMIYKDAERVGLTSANKGAAGQLSYTREMPPFVKLALERYRRVVQWT